MMNDKWVKTCNALKKLFEILSCSKCKKSLHDPQQFLNCGHFSCISCINNQNISCVQCQLPCTNGNIIKDDAIKNIIQACCSIAKEIGFCVDHENENIKPENYLILEEELDCKPSVSGLNSVPTNSTIPKILPKKGTKSRKRKGNKTLNNNEDLKKAKKEKCSTPLHIPKDINKTNHHGETKLQEMCKKGNLEYVKILLNAGADPNKADNAGWTPLQEAVDYSYYEISKLLLDSGADVNLPGCEGRIPLHEAAKNGNIELVTMLLKAGADPSKADNTGWTVLQEAVVYGHYEISKLLLDRGANVNQPGCDGRTPLHEAAKNSNIKLITMLLKARADSNKADNEGWTPLQIFGINYYEISKLLLDGGARIKPACCDNKIPVDSDSNVNQLGCEAKTPLHKAVMNNNIELTKTLLDTGTDPNEADSAGWTPLQVTAGLKDKKISKLLLDRGANVNQPGYAGRMPLNEAVKNNNIQLTKILLNAGANVNQSDYKGRTPLHEAAKNNNKVMTKILLDARADPNKIDNEGWTPLQIVGFNYYNLSLFLLDSGADVNQAGYEERTPLHEAAKCNNIEVINLLLKYSANKEKIDKNNKRPIDYCQSPEARQLLDCDVDLEIIFEKKSNNSNNITNNTMHNDSNNIVVLESSNNSEVESGQSTQNIREQKREIPNISSEINSQESIDVVNTSSVNEDETRMISEILESINMDSEELIDIMN